MLIKHTLFISLRGEIWRETLLPARPNRPIADSPAVRRRPRDRCCGERTLSRELAVNHTDSTATRRPWLLLTVAVSDRNRSRPAACAAKVSGMRIIAILADF